MSTARVRATTNLRGDPVQTSNITESLGAGTPVEILEDQGEWLKVKEARSTHPIPGWSLREAFALPSADVFPSMPLADGTKHPAVSAGLKANDLIAFKNNAIADPPWIPPKIWGKVAAGDRQKVKDDIRNALQAHNAEWESWLTNVSNEGRQADAQVDEWLATLQGGRDVWAVRPEMIYTDASQGKGHLGWVKESDIMRWTGKVRRNDNEPKYKIWYEVVLYKSDRMLKGWFKGDLMEPYYYPNEANDTGIDANQETIFDLSTSILRHPADKEIEDAIAANRSGYQYIDVVRALGKTKIHHNLCGQFCCAALTGKDVIPLLNEWKEVYPAAVTIMKNDHGTGLGDIKSIFDLYGLQYEEYRYSPSISPVSPFRLQKLLNEGKMVFWGVGIYKANGKLSGTVNNDKTTRHWIVLEDVTPVGNSGWVRIYNPFRNREEVYNYNVFIQSVGQFGIGLLVDKT